MQGSSTTPSAESPIGRILIAAMVTGFLALLIAAATAGYALQQGNRHTDWVMSAVCPSTAPFPTPMSPRTTCAIS